MFSALQQGSTVYILCKDKKPKLYVAKVVERTDPVPNMNAPKPMYGQPMPSVMRLVAVSGENRFEFNELDANARMVPYKENSIIAINKEDMSAEWDRIVSISRQSLDSVPYHQSIISADDEIRAILNPQYAKEQERDKEIGKLKSEMSDIKGSLSTITELLTSLNAGNVSGSRKSKD